MQFDNVEFSKRPEVVVRYNDIGDRPCSAAVCEWANGEGWDVSIQDSAGQERQFALHEDDLQAVNAAVTMLKLRPEEE